MTLRMRTSSVMTVAAVAAMALIPTAAAMPATGQDVARQDVARQDVARQDEARHQGGDPDPSSYSWQLSPSGSTARLRGLSAVSADVAWASGTAGTVLRTTDGGSSWSSVGPPDTETLQFRDIEATSASHAVALSIGEGEDSRVYVTDDGGASWTESFRNHESAAFYDCMAFFNDQDGLALSDPVDGKFRLIRTGDGGSSWTIVDSSGMPAARPGEFAFAASGTCLTT